jgi:hypothetical protein
MAPGRLAEQTIPAVRLAEILLRSDGDNPGWVYRFMAAIVVVADVGKLTVSAMPGIW